MKRKMISIMGVMLCACTLTVPMVNATVVSAATVSEEESLSSDTSIAKVEVYGTTAEKIGKTTWSVTLDEGVSLTDVYKIDFGITCTDSMAEVANIDWDNVSGVATITVRAEDGTTADYTVEVLEASSSDTELIAVSVYGSEAEKVSSTEFTVTLAEGVSLSDVESIDIWAETQDNQAEVTSIKFNQSTGIATITVEAEDGTVGTTTVTVSEAE